MNSYSSTDIIAMIASGVFLGAFITEIVFAIIQNMMSEDE